MILQSDSEKYFSESDWQDCTVTGYACVTPTGYYALFTAFLHPH